MLEKELVVLHLKVSWRSWPCVRSGLGLWNSMQVMPFQSAALTAWASSAMLGDVWGVETGLTGRCQKEAELEDDRLQTLRTDQRESLSRGQAVAGDLLEAGHDA